MFDLSASPSDDSPGFFVSPTPLKLLHRILLNFVGIEDTMYMCIDMHITENYDSITFVGILAHCSLKFCG